MTVIQATILKFNAIEWAFTLHIIRLYEQQMPWRRFPFGIHYIFVNNQRHVLILLMLLVVGGEIIQTFVLAMDLFRFVMLVSIAILVGYKYPNICTLHCFMQPKFDSKNLFTVALLFSIQKPDSFLNTKLKFKHYVERKMVLNTFYIFLCK